MLRFKVERELDTDALKDIFGDLDLHPLSLQLLAQRGIKSKEEAKKFLNPSYEKDIGDPFDIYGMKEAVKRVVDALHKGEKIAIYSDYDCDGIPGGVLLRTVFDDIGYPVEIYVPHRHNEGYGVHNHAIDALHKKGVSLIITVDLAITNIEEIAYAKSVGVDFIVTDHHLPITRAVDRVKGIGGSKSKSAAAKSSGETRQIVPDAVAVINSKQDLCNYHDDMLCGCAVAWKLSCAILSTLRADKIAQESYPEGRKQKSDDRKNTDIYKEILETVGKLKPGYEKWLLDLVGISTISDMVPLIKENRALAYFGLKVLRQSKRHGINHIFRMQGVSKEHLTEDDIAFTIAPRINAAGRMGSPIQAHNMLYEKDKDIAGKFVDELESLNNERKLSVKDITDNISFDHSVYKNAVVVVGDISWGPGILGLVAQKIIDETGKPTFVYGQGDDKKTLKGSCRSRGDIHVVELMARAQELFPGIITHSGGHEQAGGFSVNPEKIGELSHALNESLKKVEIKEAKSEDMLISSYLNLEDVNLVTYEAINALAPFGVGNAKPLFAFKNLTPKSVRWFGKKGEHLEAVYINTKGKDIRAIKFFADKTLEEKLKEKHNLCASLEKSYFGGKVELRLKIVNII